MGNKSLNSWLNVIDGKHFDAYKHTEYLCVPRPGEVKQEGGGLFREGTPYQRRGSLQLWQFLVALLDDPGNAHFIAWTGRGMEFKLIEPEEVSLNCKLPFFVCLVFFFSIKDGGKRCL